MFKLRNEFKKSREKLENFLSSPKISSILRYRPGNSLFGGWKTRPSWSIVSTEFLIDFLPRPCTPIACPLPTDTGISHTRCDPDFVPTVGNFSFVTSPSFFFFTRAARSNESIPIEPRNHLRFLRSTLIEFSRGTIRNVIHRACNLALVFSLNIRHSSNRSQISNSLNFPPRTILPFLDFQSEYIFRGRGGGEEVSSLLSGK